MENIRIQDSTAMPVELQMTLHKYLAAHEEWKTMCSKMNLYEKRLKEHMAKYRLDAVVDDAGTLKMSRTFRRILDQSLIPNVDDFKVRTEVKLFSVEAPPHVPA